MRRLFVGHIVGPPRWGAFRGLLPRKLLVVGPVQAETLRLQLLDPSRDDGPHWLHSELIESSVEEAHQRFDIANVEGVRLLCCHRDISIVVLLVVSIFAEVLSYALTRFPCARPSSLPALGLNISRRSWAC